MARQPTQDLLNTLAGTSGKSTVECLNTLAGTTNLGRKEAWNAYIGTTNLSVQQAANAKAHVDTSFLIPPTTALRNNFSGATGFTFTVSVPLTVNRLGRLFVAQNANNHAISLWISTGTVTPLRTGTILFATKSDYKNFKWVYVEPITLTPGNTYAIAADNVSAGDTFKDLWSSGTDVDPRITTIATAFNTTPSAYPSTTAGAGMFDGLALGMNMTQKLVQECVHIIAGETY